MFCYLICGMSNILVTKAHLGRWMPAPLWCTVSATYASWTHPVVTLGFPGYQAPEDGGDATKLSFAWIET